MSLHPEGPPAPPHIIDALPVRFGRLLRSALATGRRAGLAHYLAALFSIQGSAYLAQFAIARIVGPAQFAVVRTVEAALNVLLIVASLGAPMLAVTTTAALRTQAEQGRMLGRLLLLCLLGGLVTAGGLVMVAPLFGSAVEGYLRALAWVLCITACSRTCLNFFLGRKEIHRLAVYSLALALLTLAVVVGAVWLGGLRGWILGRYVGEVLFLGFMVIVVGRSLEFKRHVGDPPLVQLLSSGGGIALSLLARGAADNAGLLLLGFAGVGQESIGHFGLTNLVMLGLLILPTSVGSLALPRIVERLPDPVGARGFVRRMMGWSVGMSIILATAAAVAATPVVAILFPSYRSAVPLLWIMLLALPLRAISSLSGIVLVAAARISTTVICNLLGLGTTVVVGAWLVGRMSVEGVAWAVCAGELVSASAYLPVALASVARRVS